MTLVYSRHQYVHVTGSQELPAVVDGLEDAWEAFGGVAARVVLDNLRAAITKADRYAPIFNRTFAEHARYRGFAACTLPVYADAATVVLGYPGLDEPNTIASSELAAANLSSGIRGLSG